MALVSTIKSLETGLGTMGPGSVWIDDGGNLCVGTFPDPSHRYDFGSETFVGTTRQTADPKRTISLIHASPRFTQRIVIETDDTIYELGSAKHALLWGLEHIESKKAGTLDQLAAQKGRSKRPVSRQLETLYDQPSQRRFAEKLPTGHYVATNNKSAESLRVLKRAAKLAGLGEHEFALRKR